ncbi:hypothetical protein C2E23DRAFT_946664 [Lenzites betulinus]|nr:hypothetical protein C2E23DRAFT_946664 [Lenzites betulinus]
MATFALIFYDYAITLDREVTFVWGKRFTGATALFILNRYLSLLKYPIYIVNQLPLSDKVVPSCTIVSIYSMVAQILPYIVWAAFSALRVYAITGQNWKAALAVVLPGSLLFISNIALYAGVYMQNYPLPLGCIIFLTLPADIYNSSRLLTVLIATRSCAILSDALVISITWWRTWGIRKLVAQANVKVSLASLLLRDGLSFVSVLLIANVFHIAFSLTGRFTLTLTMEEPLTTILVSRFLLNLREADASRAVDDLDAMSRPSFVGGPNGGDVNTLRFASSFIAPLGAPLDHSSILHDVESTSDVGSGETSRNSSSSQDDVERGFDARDDPIKLASEQQDYGGFVPSPHGTEVSDV